MDEPYADLEGIWTCCLGGNRADMEKGILPFLLRDGIRIRQGDGKLRMLTLSRPTSVKSAIVIGLRYDKRDGTQSEDHFSVETGGPIESHYKGALERKWPEYRGTHRQQVTYSLVANDPAPMTLVNTISFVK